MNRKKYMYVCQIGEQICTFGKNFDFQKIISLNGNKRIRTRDLQFTIPIIKPLSYDDNQQN